MRTRRRLLALVTTLLLAAGLVAGCADGDSSAPVNATFNDADVSFAQGMIPHHEQAIEMADIALDPKVGASAAVKALATRIKAAQDPEIATMTAWLKSWDKPTTGAHDMARHGMMSADEMEAFAAATGTAFDTAFYEGMIRHHEGAIVMAEDVQRDGKDPAVKALADQVISGQAEEIKEMNAALGR